MKIKFIPFIIFALLLSTATFSQLQIPVQTLPNDIFRTVKKEARDTVNWKIKYGGLSNFSLAQSSQTNWAAGGENLSLALTIYSNLFLYYKKGMHTWDNNLDFNFGFLQTSSLGGQKNDDRINFLTKYGYKIDSSGKLFLSILFNGRSQFFDGRNYFSKDSSMLTSTFLSPAYTFLSLGLDNKLAKQISLFFSPLTARGTFILSKDVAFLGSYGLDTGRRWQVVPGAFVSFNVKSDLLKNVISYNARADFFSDYSRSPQNIDFDISNYLNFKITKYISASYSLNMIYDDNVKLFGPDHNSPALQVRSAIGIGLSMPFKTSIVKMQGGKI
ncbi:MAG: DUF3078 domain-containing protein [Chitinophagaceae bacterium]|nr:DUF3078 domain-containing protein [Chitinophagaceae bacterium]